MRIVIRDRRAVKALFCAWPLTLHTTRCSPPANRPASETVRPVGRKARPRTGLLRPEERGSRPSPGGIRPGVRGTRPVSASTPETGPAAHGTGRTLHAYGQTLPQVGRETRPARLEPAMRAQGPPMGEWAGLRWREPPEGGSVAAGGSQRRARMPIDGVLQLTTTVYFPKNSRTAPHTRSCSSFVSSGKIGRQSTSMAAAVATARSPGSTWIFPFIAGWWWSGEG